MQTHQAIVFTCAEETLEKQLNNFIENGLNLYAVDYIKNGSGMGVLLDDTEERTQIFVKIQDCFSEHNAPRIIIFSHNNCTDLGHTSFESLEEEIHEREFKLRHAVSVVQSRYPDKQTEAYLEIQADTGTTFRKVI